MSMSSIYKNNVVALDVTSDRFYPVRVYDGEGNLKYTLDSKQIKKYCEEKLTQGKHWRQARVYPIGHPLRVIK